MVSGRCTKVHSLYLTTGQSVRFPQRGQKNRSINDGRVRAPLVSPVDLRRGSAAAKQVRDLKQGGPESSQDAKITPTLSIFLLSPSVVCLASPPSVSEAWLLDKSRWLMQGAE